MITLSYFHLDLEIFFYFLMLACPGFRVHTERNTQKNRRMFISLRYWKTSGHLAGRFRLVPVATSSPRTPLFWLCGHPDPAVSHLVFLRTWRQARRSLRSMPEPRDGRGRRGGGSGKWSKALSHRQKYQALNWDTHREMGLALGRLWQKTSRRHQRCLCSSCWLF